MHIVHIASELAPLAKVGGLADVVLGLCRELSWKGHDIHIIIPKYDCIDEEQIHDLSVAYENLLSFYQGEWHANTIWTGWVENLKVYFIETHHPRFFFHRGCFYGCEDDIERFLFFSRTAIEFLFKHSINPDIIHLHDWQTSLVAALYQDMYKNLGYCHPHVVLTIHNMEYQGKCRPENLSWIGLDGEYYLAPDKMQDNSDKELINLVKGGIVYSSYVTTVSPNYAREVLTTEEGKGLQETLSHYIYKFQGILNGIDYSYWNPEIDRFLPIHYSEREAPLDANDHHTLDKKKFLKKILREKLNLAEDDRPIIGCITRLVPQKGIELIKHAISYITHKKGQFVLLGSSPIPAINEEFHHIQHGYKDHPHVHLTLHHQEELAHLIYAGCDMFIVPSLFEPCGLTQLIALKYGTVPIVRKTGGLADTIFDVDNKQYSPHQVNGYTFENPTIASLEKALDRAISCWFTHPKKWRKLMVNGMKIDFSWNFSSDLYLQVYQNITASSSFKI